MYLGEYAIDDYVDLVATAHRFSSGAAYAPTSITYTVYEDGSTTAMISATAMTNFNSVTGFYFDRIQLTSALGFENGKSYVVLIQATVDSVAAIDWRSFRVRAAAPANVTQIGGSSVDTTAAQIGVNVVNWKSSTAPAMTGDAYALTSNATYGLSALKTILDTIAGYIDTEVAAIKERTDNLPDSPAAEGSQMALTSAAVQAIWDALTSALTTSGSVGKLLADNIDAAISSRSTFAGGAVASVTGNVGGNVTGSVGSVTAAVTVGTNNDKTGYSLSTTPPTAAEIKTALEAAGGDLALIMAQTDKIGDGTVGLANLKALIDTIDAVVDAVKTQTDKLTFDGSSNVAANMKAINGTALTGDGTTGTPWGPA